MHVAVSRRRLFVCPHLYQKGVFTLPSCNHLLVLSQLLAFKRNSVLASSDIPLFVDYIEHIPYCRRTTTYLVHSKIWNIKLAAIVIPAEIVGLNSPICLGIMKLIPSLHQLYHKWRVITVN